MHNWGLRESVICGCGAAPQTADSRQQTADSRQQTTSAPASCTMLSEWHHPLDVAAQQWLLEDMLQVEAVETCTKRFKYFYRPTLHGG